MTYMDPNSEELYTIIDRAIDEAMLNGRFLFNMKSYLTGNKLTRKQKKEFGQAATFPQVIIAGHKMGGCTETIKYLRENTYV